MGGLAQGLGIRKGGGVGWDPPPPPRVPLGVRETVAGHRLGALEEGGGGHPPLSDASLTPYVTFRLVVAPLRGP